MKTYEITPLHITGGQFNGTMHFLLDGRLLSIKFGTPKFNDYNAWKLYEMNFASESFNEDTTGFTPLDIEPFTINENEFKMIDLLFINKNITTDEESEAFVKQVHDLEASIPNCVHPYRYLDEPLLYSIEYIEGLFHIINEPTAKTGDTWEGREADERIESGKWQNKPSLLHNQGFYNFLIPVSEALVKTYDYEERTSDVFL